MGLCTTPRRRERLGSVMSGRAGMCEDTERLILTRLQSSGHWAVCPKRDTLHQIVRLCGKSHFRNRLRRLFVPLQLFKVEFGLLIPVVFDFCLAGLIETDTSL